MSFRLRQRERVGPISKDGVGKTTVLRMIVGQEERSDGAVKIEPDSSVGHFSQFSTPSSDKSIREILEVLLPEAHAVDEELRRAEARMAEPRGPRQDTPAGPSSLAIRQIGNVLGDAQGAIVLPHRSRPATVHLS